MKCANCGNENLSSLHDEGDTFFCSLCTHRTRVSDGKDDLIWCQVCRRRRDRKAYCCIWCNSSINDAPPSPMQRKALEQSIKSFEDKLTPKDIKYWKIRGKK